jgi:hypothetical protein
MAYFAIILGLAALAIGVTGKLPPSSWRPALADPPKSFQRAIYIWMGIVFCAFGAFLMFGARRS